MKYAILENLSTTTKIESLPFFDLDKPKTKSIEISIQGLVGTGNGVYSLCGCTLDFVFLQANALIHLFVRKLRQFRRTNSDVLFRQEDMDCHQVKMWPLTQQFCGLMGHFGVAKTLDVLYEHFHWPKMKMDMQ